MYIILKQNILKINNCIIPFFFSPLHLSVWQLWINGFTGVLIPAGYLLFSKQK